MKPALRSILTEAGLAGEDPQIEPPEGHVSGVTPPRHLSSRGLQCFPSPSVFSLLLSLLLAPQQMALLAASIEILIAGGFSHTVGLVPTLISKQCVIHGREQAVRVKCLPRAVMDGFPQSGWPCLAHVLSRL